MRAYLASLGLLLWACNAAPSGAVAPVSVAAVDEGAWILGTWTTSTTSWDDAAKSTDAIRFGKNGEIEHGTWSGAGFVPSPPAGPSGTSFVAHYALEAKEHRISFQLDGAEEQATYSVEGQSRWKTVSSDSEHVTVFYSRRR